MKNPRSFIYERQCVAAPLSLAAMRGILPFIAALAGLPAFCADVSSTWDGSTNNWTSNHWSSPQFPNNGNGGFTYDATITTGTVTLDQDITIQKLTLSSLTPTLTAISPFNLTLNDGLQWVRGTMSGAGQTIISPSGTLNLANSVVAINLNRTLVNNGTANWTGSFPVNMNGGTLTNNGSFTANLASSTSMTRLSGTNTFNNVGSFTKLVSNSATFSNVAFNNAGTVDVQLGNLLLSSVTQHVGNQLTGGTWKVRDGATLNFTTGSGITTNLADVTLDGPGSTFGKINSLVDNQGSFAILNGRNFSASGPFANSGTLTIADGSTFTTVSGMTQAATGTLRGSGTLSSDLLNHGAIRPGNLLGSLTISGNLTHTPTSVTEIEVGGLTAGTQHDQVIITGNAALDGRLDVPIVNGFVPQVGNSLTFLTAANVTGQFASLFSPNLKTANPNVAIDIVQTPVDVHIHFVQPLTNIHFNAVTPTADWTSPSTWDIGIEPDSRNIIAVQNLAGVDQRVNVQSADAFVHQLSIHGNAHTVTVGVKNDRSLSAIVGATVGDQAIVELGSETSHGNLVSSTVAVHGGGMLAGNGLVKGNLVNGEVNNAQPSIVRPGFSVGHLDVEGDYQQLSDGTLLIDIEGPASNQYDTIDVTGTATLDGTLQIDAGILGPVASGTMFPILTAASVAGEFDSVKWTGNNNIYFRADYTGTTALAEILFRGDMDGDHDIDSRDLDLFALGLVSPSRYFVECNCDDYGQLGGDFSGNGRLDFDDISGFSAASGMGAGEIAAAIDFYARRVPEPSSTVLALVGTLVLAALRRPHSPWNASGRCSTRPSM